MRSSGISHLRLIPGAMTHLSMAWVSYSRTWLRCTAVSGSDSACILGTMRCPGTSGDVPVDGGSSIIESPTSRRRVAGCLGCIARRPDFCTCGVLLMPSIAQGGCRDSVSESAVAKLLIVMTCMGLPVIGRIHRGSGSSSRSSTRWSSQGLPLYPQLSLFCIRWGVVKQGVSAGVVIEQTLRGLDHLLKKLLLGEG